MIVNFWLTLWLLCRQIRSRERPDSLRKNDSWLKGKHGFGSDLKGQVQMRQSQKR